MRALGPKFWVLAVLGVFLGSFQASAQSPRPEKPVTIRFASFLPENAPEALPAKWWADELKKRSNGRITVRFYWSGSLIAPTDALPAVTQGRVDVAWIGAFFHPRELPLTTITELPFVTSNAIAELKAVRKLYAEYPPFRAEYEKNNARLMWGPPTGVDVIGSNKPLTGVADLRGLRIRGGARLLSEALQSEGALVVSMVAPEIYEGMKRGVIDAWTSTLLEIIPYFGWQEVTKYVTDPGIGLYGMGLQVMNLQFFNRLSEDDKKLLDEVGEEAQVRAIADHIAGDQATCDKVAAAGMKVTVWSQEATDAWKKSVPDYGAAWIKEHSAEGQPAREMYDRYFAALHAEEASNSYTPGIRACAKKLGGG